MSFRIRRLVWVGCVVVACGPGGDPKTPSVSTPGVGEDIPPPVPREEEVPRAPRNKMAPAAVPAYEAGLRAFEAGDVRGAEAKFREAVTQDPHSYQARHALAAALERLGADSAAVTAYHGALDLVPDYEPSIASLATLYLRQNRISEAEAFLNRQLSRVPDSAAALAALAEVKSIQKNSTAAQSLARRALKKSPDYRPAMVVLARDHYRNRRLDLALYTLTAILDGYGTENPPRDPNNAEARLIRALIYKEQRRRKEALNEFERVVSLRPDLVEARLHLAVFYLEAGNAEKAVPVLEKALAYDPSNVLVHLNLGDAYRLQGRPTEAIKQLEWVTQADPKLEQAHYNLGLVYLFSNIDGIPEAEAVERAISEFEVYLAARPRTPAGPGDDAEELLTRAKTKQSILRAMNANAPPPPEQ